MEFGFASWKDVVEVLLVPVSISFLALLWPTITAWRRRKNFEYLIRKELKEAKPEPEIPGLGAPWHRHLGKHFIHQQIINRPVENTEFVLSLNPKLAYSLSQMWIAFGEGTKLDDMGENAEKPKADDKASMHHAEQWCWYLEATCRFLDRRNPKSHLLREVWMPWSELVKRRYPNARVVIE
jgi:hypothetical protein